MSVIVQDKILHERLQEIIDAGWLPIPDYHGYRGTGAPGQILEDLLEIDGGNHDLPDTGKWEVKFHGGKSPLTLFHKEGEPKGYIDEMVKHYGWRDDKDRLSFRYTIWGKSNMGFFAEKSGDRLHLRNEKNPQDNLPFWLIDTLINAFVQKLRRFILVHGQKKDGKVKYDSASIFWEPQSAIFIDAIVDGIVAIDFDARTKNSYPEKNGWTIRNHGTKFRIYPNQLKQIYRNSRSF